MSYFFLYLSVQIWKTTTWYLYHRRTFLTTHTYTYVLTCVCRPVHVSLKYEVSIGNSLNNDPHWFRHLQQIRYRQKQDLLIANCYLVSCWGLLEWYASIHTVFLLLYSVHSFFQLVCQLIWTWWKRLSFLGKLTKYYNYNTECLLKCQSCKPKKKKENKLCTAL